ncbi:MAG: TrmH family RNA methyltransferase [Bacteroidetes bacterium]|nr:MAG: TrmH family RNA methyltransferase [Bacteroidota bacterium]TAG87481.1 MAG: TrmH family RNA methyltransferase [Bacteroidota bacterium]
MRKLKLDELGRLSTEEFKNIDKNNFVIVLDNVRSMMNVGSAFRTCDAFNAEKIYLTGITGTPPHREIQKTALGATETVAWEYVENITHLIEKLKNENYEILAVEQTDNSIFLHQFEPNPFQKYAFFFGNEVEGVSMEVIKEAKNCLEIPQFGTKHSLNVSVSVGIVIWDYLSKM